MKTYGPYKRKDGRSHVIHVDGETRRTESYPRYLMSKHLGRALETWEHVDHVNNDPTDNRIENLQILTQAENNKKSTKEPEMGNFTCPLCGVGFIMTMRRYRHNQVKQGKAGPYCSRSCAGKVHN